VDGRPICSGEDILSISAFRAFANHILQEKMTLNALKIDNYCLLGDFFDRTKSFKNNYVFVCVLACLLLFFNRMNVFQVFSEKPFLEKG